MRKSIRFFHIAVFLLVLFITLLLSRMEENKKSNNAAILAQTAVFSVWQ